MPRSGGVQGESGLALRVKTCGFRTIWNSLRISRGPAGRTPHPTCAGGQDDGSYTNSLKQKLAHHVHNETQGVYSFREKYQTKGLNISVLLDGANDP